MPIAGGTDENHGIVSCFGRRRESDVGGLQYQCQRDEQAGFDEEQRGWIGWSFGADVRVEMRGAGGDSGSEAGESDEGGDRLVAVVHSRRHPKAHQVAAHVRHEHRGDVLKHEGVNEPGCGRERSDNGQGARRVVFMLDRLRRCCARPRVVRRCRRRARGSWHTTFRPGPFAGRQLLVLERQLAGARMVVATHPGLELGDVDLRPPLARTRGSLRAVVRPVRPPSGRRAARRCRRGTRRGCAAPAWGQSATSSSRRWLGEDHPQQVAIVGRSADRSSGTSATGRGSTRGTPTAAPARRRAPAPSTRSAAPARRERARLPASGRPVVRVASASR